MILTQFALLIPAFSLACCPPALPLRLLPACNALLPYALTRIPSFGIQFSPVKFSAQGHSTSELLRTL